MYFAFSTSLKDYITESHFLKGLHKFAVRYGLYPGYYQYPGYQYQPPRVPGPDALDIDRSDTDQVPDRGEPTKRRERMRLGQFRCQYPNPFYFYVVSFFHPVS